MARGGSSGVPSSVSGSFYGRDSFNPCLIIGQVVVIQLVFYLSNAIALFLFDTTLNIAAYSQQPGKSSLVLDQMLNHAVLSFHTAQGVIASVAFTAATIIGCPIAFVLFVGRSKRALDFSSTVLIAHLVCCTAYAGFPSNPLWWGLVLVCGSGMTVLCELLSRRVELRDIAVPTRDPEDPSGDDEDEIRPA